MNFWRKKKDDYHITSEEFEYTSKRITELLSRIEELQVKFKILETNYDNLRGQFNRKLSGIKKEEIPEETKDLYNGMLLPFNGTFK